MSLVVGVLHRSPVISESLVQLFRSRDIEAVGFVWKNTSELVTNLRDTAVSVVLLDPMIEGLLGPEVVDEISKVSDVAVTFIAVDNSPEKLDEATLAGAQGHVSLDVSVDEFVNLINLLAEGNVVATASSDTSLADIASVLVAGNLQNEVAVLSNRESEIVKLVATGLTNRSLADRLEVTEGTIKVHIRNIFRKLGISNRTELVIFAQRTGIA